MDTEHNTFETRKATNEEVIAYIKAICSYDDLETNGNPPPVFALSVVI
jgi:hypothetical protein